MKTILTYDQCLGLMAQLANKIACFRQYKENWSAEFCYSESQDLFERQSDKYTIDPRIFNLSQLQNLGAAKWEEESNLMLFPLWITPFLLEGIEVTSIAREISVIGKDKMDNDIRFGCVAYGIEAAQ